MADDKRTDVLDGMEEKEDEEEKFGGEKKTFLETMRDRHKRLIKAEKENRDKSIEDQKFRRAGQKDQWDDKELTRRKNMYRPALVLDELSRPINQLTGEMRLNQAHVLVIPSDDEASVETAKSYKDIIHEIEYRSDADMIYGYAGDMMVGCGYGAWRALTRYCDDNPFEQEIYLQRIKNPLLAYLDDRSKSEVYADACFGFVMEKITKDEWEEFYPGKKFPEKDDFKDTTGGSAELWFEEDGIWIADYYINDPEKKTFVMLKSDEVVEEEELERRLEEWKEEQEEILKQKQKAMELQMMMGQMQQPPQQQPLPGIPPAAPPGAQPPQMPQAQPQGQPSQPMPQPMAPPQPPVMPPIPDNLTVAKDKKGREKRREVETRRIKHYVVSPDEVLDGPNDIPRKYIPIFLCRGKETNVEGKTEVESLIRKAKDPQRLLNQVETDKAELIGMIPKAPWIGTPEQIGEFDELYAAANVENRGWLPYKAQIMVDENGQSVGLVPAPQRVPLGTPPVAVFQFSQDVRNYIEDSIGVARADTMNTPSPERTGAASRGRRKASDVGTYHYIDNLNRMIQHTGRVLVSMIPEVYDTDRDVRVMGDDDTPTFIPVNTTLGEAFNRVTKNPQRYAGVDVKNITERAKEAPGAKYNDLSKGKYDVMVKVGPPFSTAREEAAEHMMILATQGQKMNPLDKYFAVKNLDLADGGEYAEALKRQIPKQVLPPKEGEQRSDPPVPPQLQLLQQKAKTEQGKQQFNTLKQQSEMLRIKLEMMKIAQATKDTDKEMHKIAVEELQRAFNPSISNVE